MKKVSMQISCSPKKSNAEKNSTTLKEISRKLIVCLIACFPIFSFGQNGSAGNPFTQLGQAQSITAEGVYYFNLTGTTFSTYVKTGGWVQVAIDFAGSTGGAMPQGNSLTNTTRGILSSAALLKLGSATKARIYVSTGQLDVQNTNATILSRIVNNQALHKGGNDNGINNWTGTNTLSASFSAGGCNAASNNGLHQRVIHVACNGSGVHWIPVDNMRQIRNNLGEIPSSNYFQLLVQAPAVAVVNGPTINTQPSNSAQNLCLNSPATGLSVSATGTGTITYQWYKNTTASTAGGTLISGATGTSYTPPTTVAGTAYYYVIATNSQGNTTSTISGAVIVSNPSLSGTASSNQTICSGSSPTAISLSGNTGSIQWQSSTDNITFTPISGATGSTLTSAQMGSLSSVRYYRAIVTSGACSSAISNVVTINVTAPPSITVTSGSNCGTGSVSLSASTASGTINWYAASSGGSILASGNSFNTPSISATTTYYVDVTSSGCTSTPRIAATATINNIPQNATNVPTSIEYLVVGGGGGGGFDGAGGGGGGQVKTGSMTLNAGSYAVTIGTGGANATSVGSQASDGGTTTFNTPTPISSIGGGGGGSKQANGRPGANGGGAGHHANTIRTGGTSSVGGFSGGNNGPTTATSGSGGGGGGGAAGSGSVGPAGNGGAGVASSITGTLAYYGGGGGGGSHNGLGTGIGGIGGGGTGGRGNSPLATAGSPNTGGGGGGAGVADGTNPGRPGGSGVVIIRYAGTPVATGGIITQNGGYTIHTFNSNGTFAYNGAQSGAVVPNASICGPGLVTLSGTTGSGMTLDWYDAAIGGTLLSSGTINYTTPVLTSTTVYYVAVRNTSTGCTSASRTAVTVTINGTAGISANQTICSDELANPIVLSNPSGSIQWQSSNDNVSFINISGQNSSTLDAATIGNLNATKYYRALITNGACSATTPVHTITVNPVNINATISTNDLVWRGILNNNWEGAGNWYLFDGTNYSVSNAAPTNLNNVVIPANQSCVLNQPVMGSLNSSVKNITIDSGATVTASNGTLSVNGNFINHGSFIQGTGTVKMVGSNPTDSIVCDGLTNTFYNLTIEKINGNHVQLNAAIAITNQLSLINKDLFLNGNVIDLGNSGQLINEGSGHRVYCDCSSGYIQRTASISAIQTTNPGNLGLTFNTTGNQLGTTVIRRRHSRAGSFGLGSVSGTTPGVYRIYEVIPQFNGSDYTAGADPGLNLNLEFAYLNEEIGSEISSLETDFGIFRSTNLGNTWNAHFGTVNTTSNVVSISNFDAFSWVTVGPNTVTALPVELTSFQANCKEDGTTAITWVTASEYNSSHFELEKSRDGLSWASEGIIAAAGNSINTINYELTDSDRNTTMVYYLLHQYDNDGEKTTYGPVSIDCGFEDLVNFYTFPNPGTSGFSLYFNAGEASGKAKLTVYDSDGRKMIENETEIAKGNNVIQMNNEPLNPGFYFIQLQIDEGLPYWTEHVVK